MPTNINETQVNIIYSNRKTIAIRLRLDGIFVRAPKGMSRREINFFLDKKRSWIEKHLEKMQKQKMALEELEPFTVDDIEALAQKALDVIP